MSTIVPTGGIKIADQGIIEAYLGSCVGITLWDRRQRVGGLIHILLPEPISQIPEDNKSYYATTGVPIFIERMKARYGVQLLAFFAFSTRPRIWESLDSEGFNNVSSCSPE